MLIMLVHPSVSFQCITRKHWKSEADGHLKDSCLFKILFVIAFLKNKSVKICISTKSFKISQIYGFST